MNPLDELPLVLDTPEAKEDRARFILAIAKAKGQHRFKLISQYVNRYKEVPTLS